MTIKATHITIQLNGDTPGQVRLAQVEELTRGDGTTTTIPAATVIADPDSPVVVAALGAAHAAAVKQMNQAIADKDAAVKDKTDALTAVDEANHALATVTTERDDLTKQVETHLTKIAELQETVNASQLRIAELQTATPITTTKE